MELEQLLTKIDDVKTSIKEHKRLLKNPGCEVDRAARLAVRLNAYEVELDNLMLIKTQHDLVTYIQQGGKPVIRVKEKNLFQVSIPGSTTAAFVNQEGLDIIEKLMNGNTTPDEGVRKEDEEQSDAIGEGDRDNT